MIVPFYLWLDWCWGGQVVVMGLQGPSAFSRGADETRYDDPRDVLKMGVGVQDQSSC
jgi:hypothetical protein